MGYYAAGGYYQAGGFGKFFKKAVRATTKFSSFVAGNALAQSAIGFIPGGSTIMTGIRGVNMLRAGGTGGGATASAIAQSMPGHPVTQVRARRKYRRRRR